jgi:hypothetical protein
MRTPDTVEMTRHYHGMVWMLEAASPCVAITQVSQSVTQQSACRVLGTRQSWGQWGTEWGAGYINLCVITVTWLPFPPPLYEGLNKSALPHGPLSMCDVWGWAETSLRGKQRRGWSHTASRSKGSTELNGHDFVMGESLYSTRDQTVRFPYVTNLLVEGKQTHILCNRRILPT